MVTVLLWEVGGAALKAAGTGVGEDSFSGFGSGAALDWPFASFVVRGTVVIIAGDLNTFVYNIIVVLWENMGNLLSIIV